MSPSDLIESVPAVKMMPMSRRPERVFLKIRREGAVQALRRALVQNATILMPARHYGKTFASNEAAILSL